MSTVDSHKLRRGIFLTLLSICSFLLLFTYNLLLTSTRENISHNWLEERVENQQQQIVLSAVAAAEDETADDSSTTTTTPPDMTMPPRPGSLAGVNATCRCVQPGTTDRRQPQEDEEEAAVPFQLVNTTCSRSAYARGPGQRVIAFTYYEPADKNKSSEVEEERGYLKGVAENLELVSKFYPGYVMRVYYEGGDSSLEELCNLACNNNNFDICPIVYNPRWGNASRLYPLIWRFLPTLDPQVVEFHSRDLDSRISAREIAAVNQFLRSNEKIHVMRDNPNHSTNIMGGMWGAKLNLKMRALFKEAFTDMFKDAVAYLPRHLGGWDQIALTKYVWPWAQKTAFQHDSFTCRKFPNTHPFPTQRLVGVGNYVGSIVSLNATVTNKCPYRCRPREHRDWSHC